MKKLSTIFCILFCFLSSSKVSAEFHHVNPGDITSVQKVLKLNPKIHQHLIKIEPQWKKILNFRYNVNSGLAENICLKLYNPFKGMVFADFFGLSQNIMGVVELDLSQYRINTVVKKFKFPDNFDIIGKSLDLSNTNLQGYNHSQEMYQLKLNNNLLTKWESIHTNRFHLEVRNNNISTPFTEFLSTGSNNLLEGNLQHLDISNNFIGHKTSTKARDNISTNFMGLSDTLYIDISCNGFKGNMFSDNPKQALRIAQKYRLGEKRKQGLAVRFIATAKKCLPGRKHNVFTNQNVMEQYGFEFGKKEHVITQGVRDKLISQGQGDLLKEYEPKSKALTAKDNKYYSKVSQKIRDMVGRFISRFQQKLQGKVKAEIFKIKKSELQRIAAIAKKYTPLSQTDEYMLRYLWEEITNIQPEDDAISTHSNRDCVGRYKKYFVTQRDCRGGLCYKNDLIQGYLKALQNGALKVCEYQYFCKDKQGNFSSVAKDQQDRQVTYSGQKLYNTGGECYRYNKHVTYEFINKQPAHVDKGCTRDASSPTYNMVEK